MNYNKRLRLRIIPFGVIFQIRVNKTPALYWFPVWNKLTAIDFFTSAA